MKCDINRRIPAWIIIGVYIIIHTVRTHTKHTHTKTVIYFQMWKCVVTPFFLSAATWPIDLFILIKYGGSFMASSKNGHPRSSLFEHIYRSISTTWNMAGLSMAMGFGEIYLVLYSMDKYQFVLCDTSLFIWLMHMRHTKVLSDQLALYINIINS